MNSPRHHGDWAGAGLIVSRLLEQALIELNDADDPLARLAAGRCVAHLAACAECVTVAGLAGPRDQPRLLREAWQAIASARCNLDLVRRRGAIAPSSFRALASGCEVLRRRFSGALPPADSGA